MIITLLYTSLAALMLIFLSVQVIKRRVKGEVALGDGGNMFVLAACRAHSNFLEYTMPFLLLLALLESIQTSLYFLHIVAIIFFMGRIAHAYSLLKVETYENGKLTGSIRHRQGGMMFSFLALFAAAAMGIYSVASYYFGV